MNLIRDSDCFHHMYIVHQFKLTKINLLNKLSEAKEVLVGTEQGHHMSAEIFKCYLLELSENLDSTEKLKRSIALIELQKDRLMTLHCSL